MLLLQDLATATAEVQKNIVPPDSVREGARQMIAYAKTDPEGF